MVRGNRGEVISEFAAAVAIFVCCLLPPLINMAAIPFRYLAAYALVCDLTHKASLCNTRTGAMTLVNQPDKHQALAKMFGFTLHCCAITIVCRDQEADSITLPYRRVVPAAWLPGGQKGQCQYLLQTQTDLEIPPLICFNPRIPVLSAPVNLTCTANAPWENLGCDPITKEFYINE